MVSKVIVISALFLITASAYNNQGFNNPSYERPQHKRVNEDQAEGYQEQYDTGVYSEEYNEYNNQVFKKQLKNIWPEYVQFRRNERADRFGNNFRRNFPSMAGKERAPKLIRAVMPLHHANQEPKSKFVPEIPEHCRDRAICEDVLNYPYEYIENLISQVGDLTFFNLDVWTPESSNPNSTTYEVLCDANETVVYPKAAKTPEGKWVYILNKRNENIQGFKVELCFENRTLCKGADAESNYQLQCTQKYYTRPMWSLDETGRMVSLDIATPLCCTCEIIEREVPYFYLP